MEKKIAEQKLVIDIDLAPNVDEVYSGKCLVANSEIIMLLNFDEESGEFDGFTIVKNSDVEKYRTWDENDYIELKNNNSEELINNIDLNDFLDLESSLKSLVSEIVAIFTYDDYELFSVGKILWVTNESVELHLIDRDSKWSDTAIVKLSDISYLGFDTKYEKEIKENVM